MANSPRSRVRKGRVYHVTVDQIAYRAFVWKDGIWFWGRVEEQPQITPCRGRTEMGVRDQLCIALAVGAPPAGAPSLKP